MIKTLEEQVDIWHKDDLSDTLLKEMELVSSMTPEELDKALNGLWEAYVVPKDLLGDKDD